MFLDIAWIKEKLPERAEHIKKKLPSMYHQFKELAGIDITAEPMEVGPTTHYVMGGIRVDGRHADVDRAGAVRGRRVRRGLHGANRLGGNSLSDLLVFGKRAGRVRGGSLLSTKRRARSRTQVGAAAAWRRSSRFDSHTSSAARTRTRSSPICRT